MIQKILENRFVILYVIPFILGFLTVLTFQPFNISIINFFIFPLLFYLLVYVKKKSSSIYRKKPFRRNLFIIGFIFGFGFYLSGIFWISYSLTFDPNLKFLIPFAILVIPLFLALFYGLTTLIIGPFLSLNFSSILLFSASISFSDYLRSKILTGFPWNLWAYSWSWLTEFLQILNLIGLFAFNLLIITIFTLPVFIFFKYNLSRKILILSLSFLLIFLNYIYGSFVINKNKAVLNFFKEKDKTYIKVISPNFDLKYNLSLKEIENKLKKLIKYSNADKEKETIFIWPEGAFSGFSYNEILHLKNLIKNNFSKNHYIIFGINTLGEKSEKYFNSFVVVNNNFDIIYKYNKNKLVPFGEFLPFESFLQNFGLKKITEGYGSFLKGGQKKNFKLNTINLVPLICYEIIFTELLQKTSSSSNLIVNISEDAWFGDSIGPHQHFAKAIFRAIENNSFLVRSANKGITAIINNKGEIVKKLNTNETGNIEMNIPIIKSKYKNKNDLIFFSLLFTYLIIFKLFKNKKNAKK
tara:strand:+ start:16686 stop:18260 length:1575 start_codon:yes stop_codon:yes gene_type:complete